MALFASVWTWSPLHNAKLWAGREGMVSESIFYQQVFTNLKEKHYYHSPLIFELAMKNVCPFCRPAPKTNWVPWRNLNKWPHIVPGEKSGWCTLLKEACKPRLYKHWIGKYWSATWSHSSYQTLLNPSHTHTYAFSHDRHFFLHLFFGDDRRELRHTTQHSSHNNNIFPVG